MFEIAKKNKPKAQAKLERQGRAQTRKDKEGLKSRGQWLKEAQTAVNAYVRERDADLPCVSCGRRHDGQYHAGHYRSVGSAPELRFETIQIWKQCAPCNNHLSGNLINYRTELIKRIGIDKVEWIEGKHAAKRYTIDQIKEIKAQYKLKLKEIKANV